MAAGSEQLFVSRLARLPVRAPSGETIGRIADVVIARLESGAPPPVLGFTVMVQRRPIFLGVGRVRELDESGAVLSTGSVNLRPFQQREGETLVIGELLDARVRHRETGKRLRLNDVAIGRVREEWVVTALDVLEPGG
ncbi:MAG TPA: magnesium transporter, partial [Actinomycetes bacterium]|nr:magnesium transporter [Actinomycetes bacterium]